METQEHSRRIVADFYKTNIQELRGFIRERTGGADCSDDIAQDVFVRLLRSGKMITPITLPCLVYTTARNLITDYWRHRQAIERYGRDACPDTATYDASTIYSAKEIALNIERRLSSMPEESRLIYRLHIFGGMKAKEIADHANIKYKVVERRLGQARQSVRRMMSVTGREYGAIV